MIIDLNDYGSSHGPDIPSLAQLRELLAERMDTLFRAYWGEPLRPGVRDWRPRGDSAKSMLMRGADRGVWRDHKTTEGGGPLEFYARYALGWDGVPADAAGRRDLCEEVSRYLGIDISAPASPAEMERRRRERAQAEALRAVATAEHSEAEEVRKAAVVAAVVAASRPVQGTPAEAYLRSRGIDQWPAGALAYVDEMGPQAGLMSPQRAALVVWARDDAGEIVGGQRVLIDVRGGRVKAPDETGELKKLGKMSFGQIGGSPARFPARAGASSDLIVAEGPETALAIWQAMGCEVWAVFGAGQFKTAPLPLDRRVILAPDQDAPDSPAAQAFADAVTVHSVVHPDLWIACAPEPEGSKGDLNDTLMRAGAEAVRDAIAAAVRVGSIPAGAEPLPPLPSIAEAREGLREAMVQFNQAIPAPTAADTITVTPPPQTHLINVTPGLGKSAAANALAVARLVEQRKAGIEDTAIVIAAPMHRLNDEVAETLNAGQHGLRVVILRGPEALLPGSRETVCSRLEEYRHREVRLLDGCSGCPVKRTCLYQTTKKLIGDIYLISHAALPGKPPTVSRQQRLDCLIVDESPMSALVFGADGLPGVGLAAWLGFPLPKTSNYDRADLADMRVKLGRAVEANGPGHMSRAALSGAGIAEGDARSASALEWRRKVEEPTAQQKLEMKRNPGGDDYDRTESNIGLARCATIWRTVADFLQSGDELAARLLVLKDPERGAALKASGVRRLHAGWASVPILMLDGTADHVIAETLIGRTLGAVTEVRCAIPMLNVRQDEGFTGAKNRILDPYSEKDEITVRNNQTRLERMLKRVAQATTGQTAFFSYAELEEAMESRVPEGMLTGHFNNLRGVNAYGAANAGVIIGRTLAPSQTLEHTAEAIFNRVATGEMMWKAPVTRLVRGADDRVYEVLGTASSHEDENVRRVIHQTRDAEVIQALHRLRPVNRVEGRDQPVEIIIASDAVLDVPVQLGPHWALMTKADPIEDMLAEAGIAFLSPSHASVAFPNRWATKQAAQRVWSDVAAIDAATYANKVSIGESCRVVTYGQVRQADCFTALVDPARHPDPVASIQSIIPTTKDIRMEQPEAETKEVRMENERYSAEIILFISGGKLDLNLAETGDAGGVLRAEQAAAFSQLVNLQQFKGMSEQEAEARVAMLRRRAKALRSERCDDLADAKEHLAVMADVNELALTLAHMAA